MGQLLTSSTLAKKLGLSRATIAIVLKGDAAKRKIPERTVQRVLAAVREHNYIPNHAARSLRRRQSNAIGVILPDFQLDWTENVMVGMMDVFERTNYTPFVAIHRFNRDLFRKELLAAVERRDEALICFPLPGMADLYAQIHSMVVPLVFLSDYPLDRHDDASWVVWDAAAAVSAAVQHLVAIGRRRIGFLGVDFPMAMSRERFKAFTAAVKKAKLPLRPEWIWNPESGETHVERGLDFLLNGPDPRPDALFVLNDGMGLYALESLRRRGVRVPQDLAIISMGDLRMAGHAAIGLSTMHEPLQEMGRVAAEVALKLVADPRQPIHEVIPCNTVCSRRTTIGEAWNLKENSA